MKKRLIAMASLVLVLILAVSLSGCGKKNVNINVVTGTMDDFLVAEKVGTVNRDDFTATSGGLYYKGDNGLYGIMSLEGLFDTGANYAYCKDTNGHFIVSSKLASDYNDIAGINSFGVINGKGQVIVPAIYANFYFLNSRFVQVFQATERTYIDTDESIIKFGNYLKVTEAPETEAFYKGNWYVYDLLTGKQVPGVTGTKKAKIMLGYGNFLVYKNDADERLIVDAEGNPMPEDTDLMEDGSYTVEGQSGELYDTNKNKLFSYDLTGFVPKYSTGDGQYVATKVVDGKTKSVVMDKTGNVISAEFEGSINVYGEVVFSDNQVYNLKGENILSGKYNSIFYDKIIRNNWILKDDGGYTMIDKEGTVYFTGDDGKKSTVYVTDFVASKKISDKSMYYSHKDRDYTIEGYAFAPWIVKVSAPNYRYNLIDTMTGEVLLEGYKSYSYTARNAMAYYVYAEYEGGTDVYLIVANSRLADVNARKGNLLDDLIAAFEAEGITVIVNKEDGTMSLDSGVLFGGDSAELSAEGKAFLNKFIKAYTNVAFSEKYAGFISKTMVEGHTAPVDGSTYESGLQLSVERANNVRNYCLSAETGVDVSAIAGTLEPVGYSNSQPVYDASGNVDMAASRRVTFRFLASIDM